MVIESIANKLNIFPKGSSDTVKEIFYVWHIHCITSEYDTRLKTHIIFNYEHSNVRQQFHLPSPGFELVLQGYRDNTVCPLLRAHYIKIMIFYRNNSKFSDHVKNISLTELEIKYTTNTVKKSDVLWLKRRKLVNSASYIDLQFGIYNEGQLGTKLNETRKHFCLQI